MLGKLIQPEIESLIQARNWIPLKEIITDMHPSEVADVISDIPQNDRAIIFRLLPKESAYKTFEYLEFDIQEELLKALGQEELAEILNEMSPDDRTEFLEELPGPVVKKLIRLLSPEERSVAVTLLGYPENSVGRIMTPDFIAVKTEWDIGKVLQVIRELGNNVEYLDTLFITDTDGRLLDELTLKEVVMSTSDTKVSELMNANYVSLKVNEPQENAVRIFKEYDLYVIPVVNDENYLVGIVTADDVFDVIEEESTEDIQKFGGMAALDEPYMSVPLFHMVKKRAGWLVILFLGEMLTATAMGFFEHQIAKAVVLALFIPLIISSGGNSGSQAATLTIRAMALGEIRLRDWFRVMKREILSGLMLGIILGFIGFLRISIWNSISNMYGEHWFLIGLTIFFTLIGVVMWGTFSGSMLPFLLRKFGLDPAASSAPFVATLVDVSGLLIYFSVAALILTGKLL
ncbi:MAG TPA: magnesium transporter [Ignavibacteria bacterium]|nr:magnesium transporter [Ignavibacteria bacterium]